MSDFACGILVGIGIVLLILTWLFWPIVKFVFLSFINIIFTGRSGLS